MKDPMNLAVDRRVTYAFVSTWVVLAASVARLGLVAWLSISLASFIMPYTLLRSANFGRYLPYDDSGGASTKMAPGFTFAWWFAGVAMILIESVSRRHADILIASRPATDLLETLSMIGIIPVALVASFSLTACTLAFAHACVADGNADVSNPYSSCDSESSVEIFEEPSSSEEATTDVDDEDWDANYDASSE
jgi:hypothetical protein